MTSCFEELLENSLKAVYYNDPTMLMELSKIDYSQIAEQFKTALWLVVDPDEFYEVDEFLRSDVYKRYEIGMNYATMEVSKELANLVVFAGADAKEFTKH